MSELGWIVAAIVVVLYIVREVRIRIGLRKLADELVAVKRITDDETRAAKALANDAQALVERFRKTCENP